MLKRIAKALDVNIVDFFMDESLNHEDVVSRAKDRVDIRLRRWDAKIQSLVRNTRNKKMQPFFTVIKPLVQILSRRFFYVAARSQETLRET